MQNFMQKELSDVLRFVNRSSGSTRQELRQANT
jgi:hypothetical protein